MVNLPRQNDDEEYRAAYSGPRCRMLHSDQAEREQYLHHGQSYKFMTLKTAVSVLLCRRYVD